MFLGIFCAHFLRHKLPKLSPNYFPKTYHGTTIATKIDFGNCCFAFFFAINLDHLVPKRAPEQPRNLPKYLQRASRSLSKQCPLVESVYTPKVAPKCLQKLLQRLFKNWSQNVANFDLELDPEII